MQYIAQDLSIRRMWQLYSDKCNAERVCNPIKEKKYRDIFCENYNMSFFKPKKDQCSICNTYEQKKQEGQTIRLELEKSHEEHQERKVAARNEKENDKERAQTDKSFHASAFDLQATS